MMTQNHREQIYSRLLSFISYKPRTEKEVKDKISLICSRFKNLEAAEISKLLDYFIADLKEINLLDDTSYAKKYLVEQLNSSSPKSPIEISTFLYKKGIPKDIISRTLNDYSSEMEVASIKYHMQKKSKYTEQKLINYLLRKGFQYSNIQHALKTDLTINSN